MGGRMQADGEQELGGIEEQTQPAIDGGENSPRWTWRHFRRPLDFLLNRQLTRSITREQVHNLRVFWLDGIYAAISEGLVLTFIPLFALAYGASARQIGLISAFASLVGAIALFPGARLIDLFGKRKPLVVWSSVMLFRVPLLLLALVPLFFSQPVVAIGAIILLNSVRAFGVNLANPAWTSLTADIVPEYMRGRYFSIRNFLMGVATLLMPPLAGWLIRRFSDNSSDPYLGYQIIFVLGFVGGMVSSYHFSRIVEPPMRPRRLDDPKSRRLWAIVTGSPGFLGFVVSAFIWNMSLQIAGPYFSVYLVRELGADAATVGLTTAASSLAALVGQLVYGRWLDRKGMLWVFMITGFPIVLLPIWWVFYTAPWQVGLNNLIGGFLWAGFNLANFNLLLKLTPDDERPRAVAFYQTAVVASAVIGPLIGGAIVESVGFSAIFVLSGLGRLVAMFVFVRLAMKPALRILGR
jgi:MFS family permease